MKLRYGRCLTNFGTMFRVSLSRSKQTTLLTALMLALCLKTAHGFHNGLQRSSPLQSLVTTSHPVSLNPTKLSFSKRPNHKVFMKTDPGDEGAAEIRKGVQVLLTVPMAWGTFEPAVRYVYEIQPDIPPFVFSLVYYLIAATALGALALLSAVAPDGGEDEMLISTERKPTDGGESPKPFGSGAFPIQGGLELGTYLFLGNALQVIGLKTVASDRAAFLLQLTTIFVPLVQSIQAKDILAVPTKTWIACLVALSGVAFIGLDGANEASMSSLSLDSLQFSIGDLYIALGAFFYTFHCIRLEKYAKTTSAVKLAAAKATTETMWCALVVLACIVAATSDVFGLSSFDLARTSGDNILAYQEALSASLQDPTIPPRQWLILGAATAWTGLVTIAYTIYAQSFGQARVPPATANLIYTIQPFFTALVAFLVLGEKLGPAGYVGGVLIGGAVLLVIAEDEDPSSGSTSRVEEVGRQ